MANAVDYFKTEKDRHVKAANEIIEQADKEGRGLEEDEREIVRKHTTAAAEFQKKIQDAADNEALQDEVRRLGETMPVAPETPDPNAARGGVGDIFVASEAYKALQQIGTDATRFTVGPVHLPMRMSAVAGIVTEGTGANADMFLPQRIPGIIGPVEAPLALADLFGQGTVGRDSNTVLLVRETVTDNAAEFVPEGAPKPPSDIGFTTQQVTLAKIATVIKVSNEMLEDTEAMASYLNGRLSLFVRQREEDEIVDKLLGQAGQSADGTEIDGDNLYDAILAGITLVRETGGLEPDAVVMTPIDFARMSVMKDNNGVYFSGGPYAGPADRPWNLRRVLATRLGEGNVIVGAFREGGTIWRKGAGVSVTATNSNEDDFINNLVAIRAEERMAVFLERPLAFCTVSFTS